MSKFKNNYLFFKPFFQLLTGSFIAQIITIIASPITTRLFTKEELGIYTLILTVVSIFSPVLNGRFDLSIVSAKDKESEFNLIILSLVIGLVSSAFISFVYIYLINDKIKNINVKFIFLFLLLILVGNSLINVLSAYNNKNKEYKLLSEIYVKRTLAQNTTVVLTGLLKLGALGLLISQVTSVMVGIRKQAKTLLRDKKYFELTSLKSVKKVFIINKKQLIFSVPSTILNTSSYSILNFFITALYGLKLFGLYSMAYRILGLPLSLISGNVSRVYFQQSSEELNEKGSYRQVFLKYSAMLFIISFIMVIFLVLFSPMLFEIVFGKGWGVAGEYVKILAPMYGVRLIVSSLSISLIVSKKQHIEMVLQILFIVSSSIIYVVSRKLTLDPYVFFRLISIAYSTIYIIFYLIMYYFSGKGETV